MIPSCTRTARFVANLKIPPVKRLGCCRPLSTFSNTQVFTPITAKGSSKAWRTLWGATLGGLGLSLYSIVTNNSTLCEFQEKDNSHLPTFSREDVSKHNTKETGIWVIFKDGVYDITEFVEGHPGGLDKIMMAAGSSIEPFWKMYQQHNVDHIREMLEEYRIGNLRAEDRLDPSLLEKDANDPYANEPERPPLFRVNSQKPFNAEPPLSLLIDKADTPNEIFFVRNHLPVPLVDPQTYVLEVQGEGVNKTIYISLEDLKTKFPKQQIRAVVQCAGNRRSELTSVKPVKGLSWGAGAISNAKWGGVFLRDILKYAGVDENDPNIKHIIFEGLDKDITSASYGASVPIDVYKKSDVLLAYEMNGEELPRDHGYPVRAVVPGVVGARNVKWLSRIITSKDESTSFWQQNDYKGFSPSVNWDNVDYKTAPAIQELPVQSAICEPKAGAVVKNDQGSMTIQGYAWSGGGRGIVRVDVSYDGGKTWQVANLQSPEQERGKVWSWTKFKTEVTIPENYVGPLDVCCRAVDDAYNTQPDTLGPVWNLRGVLNNAWHHVCINVVPSQQAN